MYRKRMEQFWDPGSEAILWSCFQHGLLATKTTPWSPHQGHLEAFTSLYTAPISDTSFASLGWS